MPSTEFDVTVNPSDLAVDFRSLGGILFLSLVGILSLGWVTQEWGMGLSPDSASYISAARGLVKGLGLIQPPQGNLILPMFSYAPFFSIILAGIGLGGIDPIQGARLLNIFMFGANIFLIGFVTHRYTQSRWVSWAGSFFALTSLVMLELHAMVWSEAVFIFFGFLGLFLLTLFLDGRRNYLLFLFSSVALGLAFLTKYSGVSFVAGGVLATFLLSQRRFVRKIVDCLVLGSIGCFPMSLWVLRNHQVVGRPIELSWNFEPYVLGHVRQLFAYLSMWLLPAGVPDVARGVVLLVFLSALLGVSLICRKEIRTTLPWILLLSIASHIGTYFFTTAFMGEQPFDNRALSPVFVAGVVYLLLMCHASAGKSSRLTQMAVVLFLSVLAVSYLGRGVRWANQAKTEGLAYSGREWKTSGLLQRLKGLPPDVPIFSNGADALYLLLDKPALGIPGKEDVLKVHVPDRNRRLRKEYPAELVKMKEELQNHNGVLVYLNLIKRRWYLPSEEELRHNLPLRVVEKFSDGTIYKIGNEIGN